MAQRVPFILAELGRDAGDADERLSCEIVCSMIHIQLMVGSQNPWLDVARLSLVN
jgi:hypothetical protein